MRFNELDISVRLIHNMIANLSDLLRYTTFKIPLIFAFVVSKITKMILIFSLSFATVIIP